MATADPRSFVPQARVFSIEPGRSVEHGWFVRFCPPLLAVALLPLVPSTHGREIAAPAAFDVVEVRRIWDGAPHNGFPDLVHFGGKWLCVLREGASHASADGAVRVIASADGKEWHSVHLFTSGTEDLREFEFCVMPDGRLMLLGAGCAIGPGGSRGEHTSYVSFSDDGEVWTKLTAVSRPEEDFWLKRAVVCNGRLYSVGYHCRSPGFSRLYQSADGVRWNVWVDRLYGESIPTEAALLPLEDGRMLCLQRCDRSPGTSRLGSAVAPYCDWSWKDLGVATGRPTLLQLPDARIVAPIRLLNPMRTALAWIDPRGGTLAEALELPSGGDGGYTGAVFEDGMLWVVYYSCQEEGRSRIYLARVRPRPVVPGR